MGYHPTLFGGISVQPEAFSTSLQHSNARTRFRQLQRESMGRGREGARVAVRGLMCDEDHAAADNKTRTSTAESPQHSRFVLYSRGRVALTLILAPTVSFVSMPKRSALANFFAAWGASDFDEGTAATTTAQRRRGGLQRRRRQQSNRCCMWFLCGFMHVHATAADNSD